MRKTKKNLKQFKESPLGMIPSEWEILNLGNILTVLYRYPTYYGIQYVENGVPEVRGELLLDDGTLHQHSELYRCVSEKTAYRFQKVQLETGDFVLSVRGTLGKVAIVPNKLKGAVITANLIRMQFNKLMVVSEWAKHFLISNVFKNQLDLETSATTIKTIQAPVLSSILVALPSVSEQYSIAEILDTVDEAIQQTETLIKKLKQIKAGLLHDLLTCGLDDNDQPRDPITHPEQFQDSPFGRIPSTWKTVHFGSLVTSKVLGSGVRGTSPIGQNVPLIKMGNLDWGYLDLHEIEYVSSEAIPCYEDLKLKSGDFLFNTRNTPELVGKTAVWEGDFPEAIFDNNLLRVRFRNDVQPKFICAFMSYGIGKNRVHKMSTGTTSVAAIYWRSLREYESPLPTKTEQFQIVEKLEAYDARIRAEEDYCNKLKQIKKGLMHDLLTGRIRVRVSEEVIT